MSKIRVLVIDDSALMRKVLSEIINREPDMETVGAAPDPLIAREMIRNLNPDVLTLDIEMPRMDGLDFLERLMRLRPMPVVMVSTLTERGSEAAFRAIELGAIDFVAKPKMGAANAIHDYTVEISDKIRAAAAARVGRAPQLQRDASKAATRPAHHRLVSTEKLIVIGASTGGTEAIKDVLVQMPADAPGILVTQHMPEGFTRSFAARLDGLCKVAVKEADDGERVLPGHVYIAPGHSHLLLKKSGANYMTQLSQDAPVNRHRPSVDVLFHSAAESAGKNAIGVILTGMGKDGAVGMLELRRAGAYTYAQDKDSCVVYGMPKEAVAVGGVEEVLPLHEIAGAVLERLSMAGASLNRV
ncbi:MAG TPA: chemotaxis response regulator protein-glutamate methylesterase [Burkholderiales bacterium]|nr:chemotaxis response regulator protein-glutamate methylesterase [Burkholderiales bacterium]